MRHRNDFRVRLVRAGLGGMLMCAATIAAAQASAVATSEPPQAEDLREIEREHLDALVDADVATAGSLMGDDFEVVQPLGDLLSRDEYLGDVGSGALDYLVFEPISEIEVRLYGDAAAMRYRGHVQVVVQGLGEIDQDLWHTLIYELRDGQWLAVWEQKTGVGGSPPPPADTAG